MSQWFGFSEPRLSYLRNEAVPYLPGTWLGNSGVKSKVSVPSEATKAWDARGIVITDIRE